MGGVEVVGHQGVESERPQWIPVAQMVSPGTIGSVLVAEVSDLGQRLRPETTFRQPIASLWPHNSRIAAQLLSNGVATVGDALRLKETPLAVVSRLQEYLRALAIPPHGKLIGAKFPPPPQDEQELIEAVETHLPKLGGHWTVPNLRFGLVDGVERSLQAVARQLLVGRETIKRLESEVKAFLVQERGLWRYRVTPPQSIGRLVFGAVFEKDLPPPLQPYGFSFSLTEKMRGEEISEQVRQELEELPEAYPYEVATMDLRQVNLSQSAVLALEQMLREVVSAEEQSLSSTAPATEVAVNNLLPHISLTREQLERVRNIPVTMIGVSSRVAGDLRRLGIPRVGTLLERSREEISDSGRPGKLGSADIEELGNRLQEILQLPEEIYPKGYVAVQLLTSPVNRQRSQERQQKQMEDARSLIAAATREGLTTPLQIQQWLVNNRESVFHLQPSSVVTFMVIDYLLRNP